MKKSKILKRRRIPFLAMMSKLNELRSHLERCRLLVEDISLEIHEIPKENAGYITDTQTLINTSIINTIKATVSYMNNHSIEVTPTIVIPADPINDYTAIESDEKPCEKASERRPIQYHPDPRMNKIVKVYCEMGGISLDKIIKPFSIPTPPIELYDIIEFTRKISLLREKNNISPSCAVYAHLCENSTMYVGTANTEFRGLKYDTLYDAVMGRLKEHRNWPSTIVKANWTAVNKVISPLFYFPGDKEDENLITLLIEKCVGSDKVRGGIYTFIGKIRFPNTTIEEIKSKLLERSEKK